MVDNFKVCIQRIDDFLYFDTESDAERYLLSNGLTGIEIEKDVNGKYKVPKIDIESTIEFIHDILNDNNRYVIYYNNDVKSRVINNFYMTPSKKGNKSLLKAKTFLNKDDAINYILNNDTSFNRVGKIKVKDGKPILFVTRVYP